MTIQFLGCVSFWNSRKCMFPDMTSSLNDSKIRVFEQLIQTFGLDFLMICVIIDGILKYNAKKYG